jgi:hypothetical protein
MNNNDEHALLRCYISLFNTRSLCINWNMERPPRKTVLPQDIWLYLGLLISELGVRYALPDEGWGWRVVAYGPARA